MGLLAALAIVLGYIDSLLPAPVPVPGVKLGLGNVVVVTALYLLGPASAFFLMLTKVLCTALLFGSVPSLCYSLAGGVLSFVGMLAMRRSGRFGMMGVSLAGGILHNAGQIAVASVLLGNRMIWGYFPVLIATGALTGAAVGLVAVRTLEALAKNLRSKKSGTGQKVD